MNNTTNIALSRLVVQQNALDVAAGNLANVNTPGYKAERVVFSDWLSRQSGTDIPAGDRKLAYVQDRATYRDHSQGAFTQTGNPLDLAIGGDGYFTVATARGTRLTRAGRFELQPDGTIADADGNALLDTAGQAMQASPSDTQIRVAADGTISSENGQIGTIAVVQPGDLNRMQAEGGRLFESQAGTTPVAQPRITQGAVEDSNVQATAELTRMMAIQREFQFATQFIESEGQRQQNAIDKIVRSGPG
jgi:flagellar basal-body rod protein FlgF